MSKTYKTSRGQFIEIGDMQEDHLNRATEKLIRQAKAERLLAEDDWRPFLDPVAKDLEEERIKRGYAPLF